MLRLFNHLPILRRLNVLNNVSSLIGNNEIIERMDKWKLSSEISKQNYFIEFCFQYDISDIQMKKFV